MVFMLFAKATIAQATVKDIRVEQLLTEAQRLYEQTPDYVLHMEYTMYQGAKGKETLISYPGELVKDGANYYSKIHNTETFILGQEYLKINHDQKRGYYAISEQQTTENPTVNIASFLVYFKDKVLKETDTHYICVLNATGVTVLPYGKAEIYIDKTSGHITQQVLHYLSKQKFVDKQGNTVWDYPRLQIDFTGFETTIDPYKAKFNLAEYIEVTSKKIIPKNSLQGYLIAR